MLMTRDAVNIALVSFLVFLVGAGAFGAVAFAAAPFESDVRYGDSNSSVYTLQVFLNAHGYVIASTGSGSPGNETDHFGSLSRAALIRFQSAYALPATGFFGPLTRAVISALLEGRGPNDAANPALADTVAASSGPDWIDFFNKHAPPAGWIPGFGGGGGPVQGAQNTPDTTAPSVSITSPASSGFASSTATFTASASDNVAVAGVTFYLHGVKIGAEMTSSPYQVSYDTTATSSGVYTIVAVARDTSNNYATSSVVSFTIDNTAPSVSITAPGVGAYVAGTTPLSATVTDSSGVSNVRFQVDGSNIGSLLTSSPYSFNWDSTAVSDGTHTLTVIGVDAAGNTGMQTGYSFNTLNAALTFSSISGSGVDSVSSTVTWTTNQLSDSKVVYSTDLSYGSSASSGTNTTSHSVGLGALPAGTYHYKVVSKNQAGVTATSTDNSFTIIVNNPGA